MIRSEFMAAINQVCSERGIEKESLFDTLKHAILAAYRKDYGEAEEEIEIRVDKETGAVSVWKEDQDITPPGFGRIAAQTAKQVILQGVREAEKSAIVDEFQSKVGTIMSGMLQRREGPHWIVDLGRTTGFFPRSEQVRQENYRQNQRLYFYIKEIQEEDSSYRIIVSRTASELVEGLFEQEIPEVSAEAIEIKKIAREPGQRTKVAVTSVQEGVDAVGSCVGQRGVRVQAITDELNGERIDVILWSEDKERFVASALSPAEVTDISIDEDKETATVKVPDDQLSLAIGKEGQNARLAAKLTGYRIDIHGESESPEDIAAQKQEVSSRTLTRLEKADLSLEKAQEMEIDELQEIDGIGPKTAEEIKSIPTEKPEPQKEVDDEKKEDSSLET